MTTTTRQNNLILAEDWTRIYQTFKNADFKSYDFENLRRVMIEYLRENYPEDFNDYIESSEYVALIDLIAFLGQSLAFRIDLTSRENFIELANRKESVLRLARMLSYNSKRNIAASGLLKFDTVSTTENLIDSNGVNLARQTVIWNDPTNPNWFEQFVLVLNSAMPPGMEFGRGQGSAKIGGIDTDQYRFNSTNAGVPIFSFSKAVAGRSTAFEVVSTSILGDDKVYEETPLPGNQYGFIYRTDGKGNASNNTGFFMMFKQGSLETAEFDIEQPTVNELISLTSTDVNNDDLWLYSLDGQRNETDLWTKVASTTGNNIIYNSIANNQRNIYSVITKDNDQVDLLFSDGVYGNLPKGAFRAYYRVSNGLRYIIAPGEMRGIFVEVRYRNSVGVEHSITVSLSLNYTVENSTESENIETIRNNAPALYYTQNRMITGEDYNLAPLGFSQDILKVKAVNRSSSGISRNYDILDVSGKYSMINVYGDDGYLYRKDNEKTFSFKYTNNNIVLNFLRNTIEPSLNSFQTYNFYITNFDKIVTTDVKVSWLKSTEDLTYSTGYFGNDLDNLPVAVGASYTTSNLKFVEPNSLIKFIPTNDPNTGKVRAFKNGELVDYNPEDSTHKKYLWTKVIKVTGDGTNAGKGNLSSGLGPITLSDVIPTGAKPSQVVPRLVTTLNTTTEVEILNLASASSTFGLRYDFNRRAWRIVTSSNIDLNSNFSLGRAGDNTNKNQDSSWLIAFVFDGDEYIVRLRGTDYVFGSEQQNRFYFDKKQKIYDSRKRTVIKDQIRILDVNDVPLGKSISYIDVAQQIMALKQQNSDFTISDVLGIVDQKQTLQQDILFEIADSVRYEDGYQSTDRIKLEFYDSDSDGVVDDPDSFDEIVGVDRTSRYLFFKTETDEFGFKRERFIPNINSTFLIAQTELTTNINDPQFTHNQLVYFYDEDLIKRVDLITRTFVLQPEYAAYIGRDRLKFQYVHNASSDRRIDPGVSNIIDVYVLVRTYDTNYRNWISNFTTEEPETPTPEALRITYGNGLDAIKSVSDEIIFHPVKYFPLFGDRAPVEFQAIFKVVKNPTKIINDNDLKVRIIISINEFFSIENWDFGDKFYASELITYVISQNSPDISNMVLVPKQSTQVFGSLLEIQANPDEVLVSAATVDNIEIISNITSTELNLASSTVVTRTTS